MTDPPGLDLTRLREHLDGAAPGLVTGPLHGQLLAGGRSNLTYLVGDGTGRWVLRRPPLGHVLATAHDMAREYRVISALGGSSVPVPAAVLHCPDPEVLGAPFYLMGYVPGAVLREPAAVARLGPQRVRALGLALIDTLADLHAVRPAAVGLAGLGRPAGFNHRQVRRWQRQLEGSRSRQIPGVEELVRRLSHGVPEVPGDGAIVHGDFRLDNVVLDHGDGGDDEGGGGGGGRGDRIVAVLDWEMCTLGDPLGDLALSLLYAGQATAVGGDDHRALTDLAGFPSAAELAQRYAARRGVDVGDLRWYRAFAAFKLAAILEGVHFRHLRGATVGAGFERIGDRVAPLVAQGLAILKEG